MLKEILKMQGVDFSFFQLALMSKLILGYLEPDTYRSILLPLENFCSPVYRPLQALQNKGYGGRGLRLN